MSKAPQELVGMPHPDSDAASQAATPRWKRWKSWIGFIAGVTLLVAAAVVIASSPGMLDRLWTNLRHAPAWAVVTIIAGPVVSWIFVGWCLQLLLRRHGMIGRYEMLMLVGSAWLFNHLPMRPGLVGRVGYHKVINGIRVRDAVEATIWSLVMSAVSNILVLVLVLLAPAEISTLQLVSLLCAPIVLFAIGGFAAAARSINTGRMLGAMALRYADVLVWVVRYGAVFAALGIDASAAQIAFIAAVSQVASLIPITGGGLGFREWGVGIAARQGGHAMEAAIGADLINRAIETLWVLPIGFYSTWWVARNVRRHNAALDASAEASIQTADETPSL